MDKKFLTLELKASSDDGVLEGYGAVTGNVDSYGDIIEKGAFANLDEFVAKGGILIGHDWGDLPVAMIESASEDDFGLRFKAKFHGDAESQRARQVVRERLEAGKFVGLSIGYRTQDARWETVDGKDVRILTKIDVFEISIVLSPANPLAGATGAKATMEEDCDAALAAVDRAAKRMADIKALRAKDGRALSEANLGRVRDLRGKAAELVAALDSLVEPQGSDDGEMVKCGLRLAEDRARALGLA